MICRKNEFSITKNNSNMKVFKIYNEKTLNVT